MTFAITMILEEKRESFQQVHFTAYIIIQDISKLTPCSSEKFTIKLCMEKTHLEQKGPIYS